MDTVPIIHESDYVVVSGGGVKRIMQAKKGVRVRLGTSGAADLQTLVGLPYGSVVRLLPKGQEFVPTTDYPDFDITAVGEDDVDTAKDNRELIDNNQSQKLTNLEVAAIREESGVEALLDRLVENSSTFQTKTTYAQEKYLKKKQKKYGTLYKVEPVTVDQLAEIHVPTISPSDSSGELGNSGSSTSLRLRVDTVALMLHHSEVHSSSRVLMFERTNGFLPCYFLTRLGEEGRVYHVLEKNAQPNTFHAKALQLKNFKSKWKAIPKNEGFLFGVETSHGDEVHTAPVEESNAEGSSPLLPHRRVVDEEHAVEEGVDEAMTEGGSIEEDECPSKRMKKEDRDAKMRSSEIASDEKKEETNGSSATPRKKPALRTPRTEEDHGSGTGEKSVSQWIKGIDARRVLLQHPCDSLVIADDRTALRVLQELFPFLSYGGNIVIYSPFLEDMTALYAFLRRECVMVRVSETWCRHVQVLPQRTHPTVNMSTAGGYLLTAVKVDPTNRPGLSHLSPDLFPLSK